VRRGACRPLVADLASGIASSRAADLPTIRGCGREPYGLLVPLDGVGKGVARRLMEEAPLLQSAEDTLERTAPLCTASA
jgi:hypothetical protein